MFERYYMACTDCGQPRGARHWESCHYAHLTSPYVAEHQCHKVTVIDVPGEQGIIKHEAVDYEAQLRNQGSSTPLTAGAERRRIHMRNARRLNCTTSRQN